MMKLAGILSLLEAGAAGGTSGFDVTATMTDAVSTVQGQLFSVLGVVVPAIVLVTGAVVGIKYGISWLKRMKG